jgi:hypothetical protein
MLSVTGLASVEGGGGRTIPLPPFISEVLSAAIANNPTNVIISKVSVV